MGGIFMKKNIKFEKKIDFPGMIGEITAISLEKSLIFKNESFIDGNLILKGKYKLTEASRIEEEFDYNIPIEISLTEKIDINTAKIDIADFYYDIENSDSIICHIELLIDALEIIDDCDDIRECDGDKLEIEIPHIEEDELVNDDEILSKDNDFNVDSKDENESLFVHLDENSETYGTFIVYIVRQNETINSIIEKYNTSIEEIEKYNDIKDLSIGTKLIIPLLND